MWCVKKVPQSILKITLPSLSPPWKSNNFKTSSFVSPILSPCPKNTSFSLISGTITLGQHPKQNISSCTTNSSVWNYSESDIEHKFRDFNVLKDGSIHFTSPTHLDKVPPTFPTNGVSIKDIEISNEVSARLFIPTFALSTTPLTKRLPVLFFIHGGAFCKHSAFNEPFTRLVSGLVAEANVIGVSVEYRLFPMHPLPACYDDSWTALQWVGSHSKGSGPDPWINCYADLSRIFVGGSSAGGNISHTLLAKVGSVGLPGDVNVEGLVLIHPYFGENDKLWMFMCPTNQGPQDPRMKPAAEDLARVACERVLVVLGEKDELYGPGKMYVDELIKSGWKGTVEIMENKGKKHGFYLSNHLDPEVIAMRKRIASFINHQGSPW